MTICVNKLLTMPKVKCRILLLMISDSFNLINLTLYIFSKDNDKCFNDLLNLLRLNLEYLHVS